MQLSEAIQLIQTTGLAKAGPSQWADLGCGNGTFTYALSHLLQPGSSIYAADKSRPVLEPLSNGVHIKPLQLDFVKEALPFGQLDGILMANALHYVSDKTAFIRKAKKSLLPGAAFLIVEYDTDTAVPVWVPYPASYHSLKQLFESEGYTHIKKLRERPSVYGRANLYAALIT